MKRVNESKKRRMPVFLKVVLIVLAALLALVLLYVAYVMLSYSRIEDNRPIEVTHAATEDEVVPGKEYTAMTYNIGFGAYTPDFTFFMDGGSSSWAASKESVNNCINGAVDTLKRNAPDFVMLQEVDFDSTRTYHIDERAMIIEDFEHFSSASAVNFHSSFLFVPPTQPHGFANSSLLTLSRVDITSSLRRSLPISEGFSKFVDLDRCYSISRVPVQGGKELVLFNTHMSAYGTDGDLQTQQITKLFGDMKQEYDSGNYVVCGGDFNHDFIGNSKDIFNETYEERTWAADFPDELIPEGLYKADQFASGVTVPSCRDCDIPYSDESFVVILDGFVVSDNIDVTYVDVLDTGFKDSDHNPVKMRFVLK